MHTLVKQDNSEILFTIIFRQVGHIDLIIATDYEFGDALKLVNYLNGGNWN